MKCKFAQFLFRAFGITGGALAVLFRSDRGGANHGSQS